MLWSPLGLSPQDKSVALHRSVGAMISKEIYIKRRHVRTGGKNEMCEIWEEIRRDGLIEGLLEGETRGRQQGLIEGAMREKLRSIQKLMSKKGYTLEEAFDIFDVPKEEQPIYRQRITS